MTPAPRLVKGEEQLPVDMRKRLSLRKEQVAVRQRGVCERVVERKSLGADLRAARP